MRQRSIYDLLEQLYRAAPVNMHSVFPTIEYKPLLFIPGWINTPTRR